MRFLPGFLALFALVFASCTPPNQGTEFEDEKNPYFRSAAKYASEQNYYAAVAEYDKALAANSTVARAHFEMGLLYGEKLGDHVSAIYHLQKYQTARPNAPNQEQVKTLIEKSKVDFLLTLPNSGMQNADEVARISRENSDLKQALAKTQFDLADAQKQLAQAQAEGTPPTPAPNPAEILPPAVSSTGEPGSPASTLSTEIANSTPESMPAEVEPAPAAGSVVKSHTVKSGDSLWKIATTYYAGDIKAGIEKIRVANPVLGNSNALKPGQVLVIP